MIKKSPALWLMVLIVGLPQLCETVYTPILPEIARRLGISGATAEYTLTIYLLGFAMGTLFWGTFSDRWGRKPGVLFGLGIFILGCLGCYGSETPPMFMGSRFIQAFGGSIGSVLGQAICRDVFQGAALGRAYATISSALAIFLALGPVAGGYLSEQQGGSAIFLLLIGFACVLGLCVWWALPETRDKRQHSHFSWLKVARSLGWDKPVLGFGVIVAACNGMVFSYFAEGPFYFIQLLGVSPVQYGLGFIGLALSMMCGGLWSRYLHHRKTSFEIMGAGIGIMGTASLLFLGLILWHQYGIALPRGALVSITWMAQMGIMWGYCMVNGNALAQALVHYQSCLGTASSLFGFFYYLGIALCTLGMGSLHNETLFPLPCYFVGLTALMLVIKSLLLRARS